MMVDAPLIKERLPVKGGMNSKSSSCVLTMENVLCMGAIMVYAKEVA